MGRTRGTTGADRSAEPAQGRRATPASGWLSITCTWVAQHDLHMHGSASCTRVADMGCSVTAPTSSEMMPIGEIISRLRPGATKPPAPELRAS